jgi:hypothetical protein
MGESPRLPRGSSPDADCILVCPVDMALFRGWHDEVGKAKCPEHRVLLVEATEDPLEERRRNIRNDQLDEDSS